MRIPFQGCRHLALLTPRLGLLTITGGLCLLLTSLLDSGPLHQCQDSSGRVIFTDSPAQLHSCRPVSSGGVQEITAPHSSYALPHVPRASPPPPSVPDSLPAVTMSMEGTVPPPPTDPSTRTTHDPTKIPPPAALASYCRPGFNPLNPFGAPPCRIPQDQQAHSDQAGPIPESPSFP